MGGLFSSPSEYDDTPQRQANARQREEHARIEQQRKAQARAAEQQRVAGQQALTRQYAEDLQRRAQQRQADAEARRLKEAKLERRRLRKLARQRLLAELADVDQALAKVRSNVESDRRVRQAEIDTQSEAEELAVKVEKLRMRVERDTAEYQARKLVVNKRAQVEQRVFEEDLAAYRNRREEEQDLAATRLQLQAARDSHGVLSGLHAGHAEVLTQAGFGTRVEAFARMLRDLQACVQRVEQAMLKTADPHAAAARADRLMTRVRKLTLRLLSEVQDFRSMDPTGSGNELGALNN